MDMKELVSFLTKLKKNNTKEWFDKNRKDYELLSNDWIGFVKELIDRSVAFDSNLKGLEAKACIFRINRDVRFSADKSPYKTNFGASINKGGKKSDTAGYYIHIEPGNSFLAGGVYDPTPERLAAIRQEIDYNFPAFKKIISSKAYSKYFDGLSGGDKLSRPPKGYEADNPAIEYLKLKHLIMFHPIEAKVVTGKDLGKYALDGFKAMKPMVDFLNQA